MGIGTCCRVVTIKSFSYRGLPEEFSNDYTFKGAPPSDDASWLQLFNDVINKEKTIYTNDVTFVRAYGYVDNDPKRAHAGSHDFTVPGPPPTGTMTAVASPRMAGDQASLMWWLLDRKSDKGKPTYLRKFIHHGYINGANNDQIDTAYRTTLLTFAGASGIQVVHNGLMSPGGPKDTDPNPGGNVVSQDVQTWVTTRTLKRRGKRPKTGQ